MANTELMTSVVFHTPNYVIQGFISLVPGARLTDFIREAEDFIAVAEVVVKNHAGEEAFRASFIDIRRDSIELVYPAPKPT